MSDERTLKIMQAMNDGNYRPPPHVVRRIEALMGLEDALYTDVRHTREDKPPFGVTMSGIGVVITTTRVIHASWRTPERNDESRATARVVTWARRNLISAGITDDRFLNKDEHWASASEGRWPYGGTLSLGFEGHQQCLELPLRDDEWMRRQLYELLPKLLGDLDR